MFGRNNAQEKWYRHFARYRTLRELKAEYRRLCKIHHPDAGGDDATMAAINAAYDEAFAAFARGDYVRGDYGRRDQEQASREDSAAFRAAVMAAVHLSGVRLELCGAWLWATGATFAYCAQLKAAGYRWSPNKNAWYWHPQDSHTKSRGRYTLSQIRAKFGSKVFTDEDESRTPHAAN